MKSPRRKNGLEGKWKGTDYPGRDFPTHSTLHFQQTSPWKSEAAHLILAWPLETGGANLPDLDKAQFLEALNCIKLPLRTGAIWTVQAPNKVCILPVISTPQIYRLWCSFWIVPMASPTWLLTCFWYLSPTTALTDLRSIYVTSVGGLWRVRYVFVSLWFWWSWWRMFREPQKRVEKFSSRTKMRNCMSQKWSDLAVANSWFLQLVQRAPL